MKSSVAAGVVLALAHSAVADEASPTPAPAPSLASAYTGRSATIFLAPTWSPGATVPIRAGLDGALRLHARHVAIEMRLGGGVAATSNGLSGHGIFHGGLSIGVALPLGRRLVVAPMVSFDTFSELEAYGPDPWVHYGTIALPLSIVFERGVVLEVFVQAGFARYYGATDPALLLGPRIGIVF